MKIVTFILTMFICIGYWPADRIQQPQKENNINNSQGIKSRTIYRILSKQYGDTILNLKITKEFVGVKPLYWDDPGYQRGPNHIINDTCIIVSFSLPTEYTGSGWYIDKYSFYFPAHRDYGIKQNSFHGKNYHGGSCKIIKDATDRRFDSLGAMMKEDKNEMWIKLEQLLNTK